MRYGITIIAAFAAIFLITFGCVTLDAGNPVDIAMKSSSEITSFMENHPGAKSSAVLMHGVFLKEDLDFRSFCRSLTGGEYYKILIEDIATDSRIVAFASKDGNVDCIKERKIPCTPDWQCAAWNTQDCNGQASITRDCNDLKDCGTTEGIPQQIKACSYPPVPEVCTENWSCSAWGDCDGNIQKRTCTDSNYCGTFETKPDTNRPCLNCTEIWSCDRWTDCNAGKQIRRCVDRANCGTEKAKPLLVNMCVGCTEDWNCSSWSSCANTSQSRVCNDTESCGTEYFKPALIQACGTSLMFNNIVSLDSVTMHTPSYTYGTTPTKTCSITITDSGSSHTFSGTPATQLFSTTLSTNQMEIKLVDCYQSSNALCNIPYEAKLTVTSGGTAEYIQRAPQFMINSALASIILPGDVNIQKVDINLSTGNPQLTLQYGADIKVLQKNDSLAVTGGVITFTDMVVPACDTPIAAALSYGKVGSSPMMYAYAPSGTANIRQLLDEQNGFSARALNESFIVNGTSGQAGKQLTIKVTNFISQANSRILPEFTIYDGLSALSVVQNPPTYSLRDYLKYYHGISFNEMAVVVEAGKYLTSGNYFAVVSSN